MRRSCARLRLGKGLIDFSRTLQPMTRGARITPVRLGCESYNFMTWSGRIHGPEPSADAAVRHTGAGAAIRMLQSSSRIVPWRADAAVGLAMFRFTEPAEMGMLCGCPAGCARRDFARRLPDGSVIAWGRFCDHVPIACLQKPDPTAMSRDPSPASILTRGELQWVQCAWRRSLWPV